MINHWDSDRWPFFEPQELLSPGGLTMLQRGVFLLDADSVDALCKLRTLLARPVIVNSRAAGLSFRGYRSPSENDVVGGAPFSFHIQGKAFDITVKGIEVTEIARAAFDAGFTYTKTISSTSLHIDTRGA